MRFRGPFALACYLAIYLTASTAAGQSTLERLPPVDQPHQNAGMRATRPSATAPDRIAAAIARPPWFRARPPLWPDFVWGAAVPVAPWAKQPSSVVSAEPNAWLRAEYLQLFMADVPYAEPLVTTSGAADQGLLGAPSTTVLFGGHGQPLGAFSGLRLSGGSWFNNQRTYGAEISAFVLPTKTRDLFISGGGAPGTVLALPYTLQSNGQTAPSSVVLGQQGLTTDGVQIQTSAYLWGVEANALRMVHQASGVTRDVSFLSGVRFMQLGERFAMSSASTFTGSVVNRSDSVHTQASFVGVQIGGRGVRRWGRLSLLGVAKIGFGATSNLVTMAGQNNAFAFGSPDPSGSPADLQRNVLYDFSVIPELQTRLSYDVRPGWRLSAGYDFLYWTRVLRPGNQLNASVDSSSPTAALTAPFSPSPLDQHSNFWLQGWSVAIEWLR